MNFKRIMTTIVGLPLVILLILFGNKYVMDCIISIIAVLALYEYSKCSAKEVKFISWLGYLSALSICFIHFVSDEIMSIAVTFGLPILMFILFLNVIVTNMKITFKDAAFTFIGILYIVAFLMFIPLLYGYDRNGEISGKILIWFVITSSWGTDAVAYIVGKNLGKHKFSKVSPNKTIEGCLGGILGAVVFSLVATYIINLNSDIRIAYNTIAILSAILSIIGQIGDFSASAIKRYFDVKDFGELFPGHGGMIDRIDSVMFIAPFAYLLLTICL